MYTTHKFSSEKGIVKGAMEYLWFKLGNPRAVRNRLKLVKKLLKETIQKRISFNAGKKTSIISLGCGSARAVTETFLALYNEDKTSLDNFDIKLLDKSRAAIDLSKQIIRSCQLDETHFTFIEDKIRNFDQYLDNNGSDIIEMVGVLDYLSDEKAIEIFRKIYNNLLPGGYFITANINNNIEMAFITKTINWSMVYRKPAKLARILYEAGFDETKTRIIYEPMKIHGVAVCQK
jgi:SAM-dependent methyltransferase